MTAVRQVLPTMLQLADVIEVDARPAVVGGLQRPTRGPDGMLRVPVLCLVLSDGHLMLAGILVNRPVQVWRDGVEHTDQPAPPPELPHG